MTGDNDENNELVMVKDPLRNSRVYHLPKDDDDEPRCGISNRRKWATVPIEDVPDGLGECGRCPKASAKTDDGPKTILKKARDGSPEDFGLPSWVR